LYFSPFKEGFESRHFPNDIWQTYKTKQLPEQAEAAHKTWISKNPDRNVHLLDDDDIENYLKKNWSNRMLEFYEELPIGVMKADLWRYCILKTNGGVYTDIDSECIIPVHKWIEDQSNTFITNDILLVGLENNVHFCQWTIISTKEHPAMKYVCNYLLDSFEQHGIKKMEGKIDVHGTTGPAIWTEALSKYIGYEGMSSSEIFKIYTTDESKRTEMNQKGVYLLAKDYFENIYSKNLYGSQNFGDGYVQWIKEV
jgi:alpha 1,6-mannosyltransferase